MKTFSRILGTIVLFFVAFFLIGIFIPTISYDIEIEIDRPTNEVFQALTDSILLPQWVNGLKSSKLTNGRPRASGAVYSIVIQDGDQTVAFEETIVRIEPDSVLFYMLESKTFNGTVLIKCQETLEKTVLTAHTTLEGNLWFIKSLLPLIKQSIFERKYSDYNNFKSLLKVK
jgi:uncharacterized protein YndB with AHSA1/START domain